MSTWSPARTVTVSLAALGALAIGGFQVQQAQERAESARVALEIVRLARQRGIPDSVRISPPYVPFGRDSGTTPALSLRDIAADGLPSTSPGDLTRRKATLLALQRGNATISADPVYGGHHLEYDLEGLVREIEHDQKASGARVRVVVDDAPRASDIPGTRAQLARQVGMRSNPGPRASGIGSFLRGRTG